MIQLKTTMMTRLSKYSPCLLFVAPVTLQENFLTSCGMPGSLLPPEAAHGITIQLLDE